MEITCKQDSHEVSYACADRRSPVIGRKLEASDAVRVRMALDVLSSTEHPSLSNQCLSGG